MASEEEQRAEKAQDIITTLQFIQKRQKLKLDGNMHKSHWKHKTFDHLFFRLREEIDELETELQCLSTSDEDLENIINECADVCNFAMFIADKAKRFIEEKNK